MEKNLNLLALAAALSPAAFAQQRQSAQPGSNDPQTQNTPAPDASADTQTQNFSGTIVKAKNHCVLKTDRMTYQLDDEAKAKQFEGKQVNVSGTGQINQCNSRHRYSARFIVVDRSRNVM